MLENHLDKLSYFVAVAKSGSIAEAARKLRLAQATLSQSMRVLEIAAECELFYRTSSGVTLSPAGEKLYAFAEETLQKAETLSSLFHYHEEDKGGVVRLGTKPPYAAVLWPNYLKKLQTTSKDIQIEFTIGRSNDELLRLLENGSVDMLMLPEPPEREHLISYKLFTDQFRIFSADSKIKRPIYTFYGAMTGKRKTVGQVIKKLNAKDVVNVDSFEVAKSFAENRMGAALMPESFAGDGKLLSLDRNDIDSSAFGQLNACLCVLRKREKDTRLKRLRHALLMKSRC